MTTIIEVPSREAREIEILSCHLTSTKEEHGYQIDLDITFNGNLSVDDMVITEESFGFDVIHIEDNKAKLLAHFLSDTPCLKIEQKVIAFK
jgi:hypothetical protein